MKEFIIEKTIRVIGSPVKSFPEGIGNAFRDLMAHLPEGNSRVYYGIGECTAAGIVYVAAAEEKISNEGENLGLESYEIERGRYLAVEILNWRTKTSSIKDVFEQMYKDQKGDRSKPSIEVYINDEKMLCLVKETAILQNTE